VPKGSLASPYGMPAAMTESKSVNAGPFARERGRLLPNDPDTIQPADDKKNIAFTSVPFFVFVRLPRPVTPIIEKPLASPPVRNLQG